MDVVRQSIIKQMQKGTEQHNALLDWLKRSSKDTATLKEQNKIVDAYIKKQQQEQRKGQV